MNSIAVRDVNGVIRYMETSGAGTELSPYRTVSDTHAQDQTTRDIALFLGEVLDADATINANTAINQETIEITFPNQAPAQGNYLCFKEGENFSQLEIRDVPVLVAGDSYTCVVAMPLDFAFTTAANVTLQNVNMAIDGSATPVEFMISPAFLDAGIQWDITRMSISMTHSSSGDDGLFGNLAKLTNGVYFRVEDGIFSNLFNAKENADFAIQAANDISYPVRSGGGGTAGTRARVTFNGQDKRGVVKRLSAVTSDKFLARVRDNLTALTTMKVMVQGQVVEP